MPSPEALCKHLDVAPSGSDPLTLDDLKTAKGTRQALQRGLIRRRPGTYLRKWLGDRLGVSERTISRYNGQIVDVHVVPTFTQTRLHWGNLNAIPAAQVAPAGTCLEDSTGKRWPAVKGIAQKLLGQGRGVQLLVRSLNYYWCGQGDPPVPAGLEIQRQLDVQPSVEAGVPVMTLAQQVARLVRTVRPVASAVIPAPRFQNGSENSMSRRTAGPSTSASALGYTKQKRGRRPPYWKPLEDAALEALVRATYAQINGLSATPADQVSLVSVRRWLDRYGERRLRTAVALLVQRHNIRHPAAFVATTLRTLLD